MAGRTINTPNMGVFLTEWDANLAYCQSHEKTYCQSSVKKIGSIHNAWLNHVSIPSGGVLLTDKQLQSTGRTSKGHLNEYANSTHTAFSHD